MRSARMALLGTLLGACLVGATVLGVDWPAAAAATLTVTSCNNSGAGSLREAVSSAASGDTIDFAMSPPCSTIHNSTGPIFITKDLTIVGPARTLALSGDNVGRIFQVATDVTAAISSITLEHGFANDGGAIYNSGTLTITNSALSGNSVSIGGVGGGIYNNGTLTITDSTVSGNSAYFGGGIYNSGTLNITDSTLSGNRPLALGPFEKRASCQQSGSHGRSLRTARSQKSHVASLNFSACLVGVTTVVGVTGSGASSHVESAPIVTTSPIKSVARAGRTTNIAATASGVPKPTVQWQVSMDGVIFRDAAGAFAKTLPFAVTASAIGNQYRTVSTNSWGTESTMGAGFQVFIPSCPQHSSGPRLTNCDLSAQDLTGANFNHFNLIFADMGSDNLTDASLDHANLAYANMIGATLIESSLTHVNLIDADFAGANLTGATLTDSNLTGANFAGANLTGANFAGADLRGVTWNDTNLTGVALTGATLSQDTWRNVTCPNGVVDPGPRPC